MTGYKVVVRNSPGWRDHQAATLGVSVNSPNWQGEKFASILQWTASRFSIIRIDVTDALYRHNFMAAGVAPERALVQANALGALWLARHQDVIDASPVRPHVIRWAEWYGHPGYGAALAGFQRAHDLNPALREAVSNDVLGFYRRQHRGPSLVEQEHGRNYLLEELAVVCLQARELPSAKIYPGDELSCMKLVRAGLVDEAPRGLENEQFARIKLEPRARAATAEFPQKAFG